MQNYNITYIAPWFSCILAYKKFNIILSITLIWHKCTQRCADLNNLCLESNHDMHRLLLRQFQKHPDTVSLKDYVKVIQIKTPTTPFTITSNGQLKSQATCPNYNLNQLLIFNYKLPL